MKHRTLTNRGIRLDRAMLIGMSILSSLFSFCAVAAQQDDLLPWERESKNRVPNPKSLTEIQLLVDVSEEERISIKDLQPINRTQQLFAKLLYRVSRFGNDNLHRLQNKNRDITIAEIVQQPGFHRLKIIPITGTATGWQARKLDPKIGELYFASAEEAIYFVVDVETSDGQPLKIYTTTIPKAWKSNQQIRESVTVAGLFANLSPNKSTDESPNKSTDGHTAHFLCDRIQWHPLPESDLLQTPGHLLLAKFGLDLSLLDTLPDLNRKRLEKEDSEVFYSMLNTIEQMSNTDLASIDVPKFNLQTYLKTPSKFHGDLFATRIDIRNIARVQITLEDVRDRLNVTQYYQLDGFIRIDQPVTYVDADNKPGAQFKNQYPVTLCLSELPAGWKTGTNLDYSATFSVFLYKLWAFPSAYQAEHSETAMQLSPLFIGIEPAEIGTVAPPKINWTNVILIVVFGVGFISVWTSFLMSRAKRKRPTFQIPNKKIDGPSAEEQPKFPKVTDNPSNR